MEDGFIMMSRSQQGAIICMGQNPRFLDRPSDDDDAPAYSTIKDNGYLPVRLSSVKKLNERGKHRKKKLYVILHMKNTIQLQLVPRNFRPGSYATLSMLSKHVNHFLKPLQLLILLKKYRHFYLTKITKPVLIVAHNDCTERP